MTGPAELVTCDQTIEQGYKQVKGELGWADFQVRSDRAIRRHWALVCCAFSFCWQAFLAEQPPAPESQAAPAAARGAQATGHPGGTGRAAVVASGAAPGAGLVDPMEHAATLLAVMVASSAARQLQLLLDAVAAGQAPHPYLPP